MRFKYGKVLLNKFLWNIFSLLRMPAAGSFQLN